MIVELLGRVLLDIAARGIAILLVEQRLTIALKISRRLYVMGQGRIVFEGTPSTLAEAAQIRREWLEV
jgi:branched-chain amino acid transport system ATP-binding protein